MEDYIVYWWLPNSLAVRVGLLLVWVWRPESGDRCLPQLLLHLTFLILGLSSNPELTGLAILAGQQTCGSLFSLPPQYWDYRHVPHLVFLYGCWVIKLSPSCTMNSLQIEASSRPVFVLRRFLFIIFIIYTGQLGVLIPPLPKAGVTVWFWDGSCSVICVAPQILGSSSPSREAGKQIVTSCGIYSFVLLFSSDTKKPFSTQFRDVECKYKILWRSGRFQSQVILKQMTHLSYLREPRKANQTLTEKS